MRLQNKDKNLRKMILSRKDLQEKNRKQLQLWRGLQDPVVWRRRGLTCVTTRGTASSASNGRALKWWGRGVSVAFWLKTWFALCFSFPEGEACKGRQRWTYERNSSALLRSSASNCDHTYFTVSIGSFSMKFLAMCFSGCSTNGFWRGERETRGSDHGGLSSEDHPLSKALSVIVCFLSTRVESNIWFACFNLGCYVCCCYKGC